MSTTEQSMERAQHTPEPWPAPEPSRFGTGFWVIGDRAPYTAVARAEADARRIVAAVNACAVIPTEALEGGVVRDLLEIIARALTVIENIPLDFYRCDECASWMQDARAAIAKAEGRDHA